MQEATAARSPQLTATEDGLCCGEMRSGYPPTGWSLWRVYRRRVVASVHWHIGGVAKKGGLQ